MKEVDENNTTNDAGRMKRMNFTEEEEQSKENPIRATDAGRNEERDSRIEGEGDTARLRSERQSVEENKKEQS